MKQGKGDSIGTGVPIIISSILIIFLLCSCAAPYRPLKNHTGYSDIELGADQFQVRFQGNADTPLERAYDFAMLRCAEVAQQHGFSHFAVIDSVNMSSAKRYKVGQSDPIETSAFQDANRYGALAHPSLSGGPLNNPFLTSGTRLETHVYFKPSTSLTIKCFPSKPDKTFTFNAAEIRKQLRLKYRL